jgi:hypothetical protein
MDDSTGITLSALHQQLTTAHPVLRLQSLLHFIYGVQYVFQKGKELWLVGLQFVLPCEN